MSTIIAYTFICFSLTCGLNSYSKFNFKYSSALTYSLTTVWDYFIKLYSDDFTHVHTALKASIVEKSINCGPNHQFYTSFYIQKLSIFSNIDRLSTSDHLNIDVNVAFASLNNTIIPCTLSVTESFIINVL